MQPQEVEEIEANKKRLAAEKIRYTVGVVWPDGRVTEHVVRPPREKGALVGEQFGDTPVVWMNGGPTVAKRYSDKGCRLLDEVCRADGCPEKYQQWREVLSLRGRVKIANVDDLYPPTVHALRRRSDAGVELDKVYIPGRGLVDATEDAKADRTASLLDAAGIGVPTPSERVKGGKP